MERWGPDLVELPGIPPISRHSCRMRPRCGVTRLALVGGRYAMGCSITTTDPWRGLPDLDLVVRAQREALAETSAARCGGAGARAAGAWAYGTVELVLDGVLLDWHRHGRSTIQAPASILWWSQGDLELDLARRDFTVNALRSSLPFETAAAYDDRESSSVLDLHGGQEHLARRQLRSCMTAAWRMTPRA